MSRVLTTEGTYHHSCYMGIRQPRRQGSAFARWRRATGAARGRGGRVPVLLERLAQAVVIVILIGTALILLEHALP